MFSVENGFTWVFRIVYFMLPEKFQIAYYNILVEVLPNLEVIAPRWNFNV